jgi:hypothetical protein
MQPTKRLKSVTVMADASYEDEAAAVGHPGNNNIATTSLLRHVADEVAPPELWTGGDGALCTSPKGRHPGPPKEDDGSGRIHHPAAPTFAKRVRGPTPPGLPAEGSGSNGGSKH